MEPTLMQKIKDLLTDFQVSAHPGQDMNQIVLQLSFKDMSVFNVAFAPRADRRLGYEISAGFVTGGTL